MPGQFFLPLLKSYTVKKIIFLSLILVIASIQVFAQAVSATTAQQVAANFFKTATRQASVSMVNVSPSAQRKSSVSYYVFQPEDQKGFVIVAGTKSATPILGYSEESSFPTDNVSPEFQYWMDGYQKQLDYIAEHRLAPTAEQAKSWGELEKGTFSAPENGNRVNPLLNTSWSQGNPYNKLCPNNGMALTGCVATAMAQVMKYWNFPLAGTIIWEYEDNNCGNGVCGKFKTALGGDNYNWNVMPNSLAPGANDLGAFYVSKLMYDCGVSVQMDYGLGGNLSGSGAFPTDIPGALNGLFGFQNSYLIEPDNPADVSWGQVIKEQLDWGMPVLYGATGDGNGGHLWVCDGYYEDFNVFAMNWGWGGTADGWFSLDNLHPFLNNKFLDLTEDHSAVINIHPPGCTGFYVGGIKFPNGTYSGETALLMEITGGLVPSGAVSNIHSGDNIVLRPGFTAEHGSTFHAWIQGCDGQFASNGGDRSEAETHVASESGQILTVFPNPFTDRISINAQLETPGPSSLTLLDFSGRVVQTIECASLAESGKLETELQTTGLATGIYLLQLQYAGGQQAVKLVKTGEK